MNNGYKFRMLTAHFDCNRLEDPVETIIEYSSRLAEASDNVLSSLGIEVWSNRVVLDNCSKRYLDVVSSAPYEDVLVSLGNMPSNSIDYELLSTITSNGLFLSINLQEPEWDNARRISKVIHKLSEEDPSLTTHIGINTLNQKIQTPYFPLASTIKHSTLTIGLLYPSYLMKAYREGGIEMTERALMEAFTSARRALELASKITGLEPGGVDLSISPWMEESTLGLVEYVAGVRLPEPGIALGIAKINRVLNKIGKHNRITGFNEVQLPVAEDLKMKARVAELETSARDLARLAGVCLAGLDLAVVPADVDAVAGILLEVRAYSIAKDKPLGVRIIPVEGVEPGDKVYLERFGETPVIPL